MGRARRAVAVGVVVSAALLAGCTVGPSQRPPVAVRGTNLPGPPPMTAEPAVPDLLPEPQTQAAIIPFYDCTDDTLTSRPGLAPVDRPLRVECGEISVPSEHDQPGRRQATLGVTRVSPPGAPEDRPPLLVLGDTAGQPSARAAVVLAGQVDPRVLENYTLVGLDRRGAGLEPLDCAPPDTRAAIVDADLSGIGGDDEPAALLERARTVVQECTLALDGGLGAYRTAATSADVELLRAALGVDRLSAIGVGDGAAALAGWARTAPRAVGRLVLDGPPHPTLDEPELTESRAAGAEAAFAAFAVNCTAAADCPLGPDPHATVAGLLTALRDRPITAVDGRRLTAGGAVTTLLSGVGDPLSWPALAAALAGAAAGEPTALLDLLEPLTGSDGRFDATLATSCNDTRRRLAPGEVADLAVRWRTAYPTFGGMLALHLLACAPWPTGGAIPPTGPADGAPPILVIGTAADPRSPLEGARSTADSLASSRFLSWQGAGTGAYPRTPCVRKVVDADLLDGVVPGTGTLCPP